MDTTSEARHDEHGRTLCLSLTKHGRPCEAPAWRDGLCREHHAPAGSLIHLGFSRKQLAIISEAERLKGLLDADLGLTLAQLRECSRVGGSKATMDELVATLRRDPEVSETSEKRPDAAGRDRLQVVVRRKREIS